MVPGAAVMLVVPVAAVGPSAPAAVCWDGAEGLSLWPGCLSAVWAPLVVASSGLFQES